MNPIRWFEIYVQDLEKTKKFYEEVFQIKLMRLPSDIEIWAFPADKEKHGSGGALVRMEGFPPGKNSTIVYFACEDCAVEASRVVKAGGKLEREKFSIGPYGFIAHAHDPEGNLIGLHSMK